MTTTAGLPTMTGQTYSALPPTLPNTGHTATDAQMEQAAMTEYQTNPAIANYINQQFGYIGNYLMSVPELTPIIVAAGIYGWNQAEFDGAVQQTSWWKSTAQSQRNFQEIRANDPATAAQQVTQMKDTILTTAQSLGVTLSAATLTKIATLAVSMNWSGDDITQALRRGNASATPHPTFGAASTFADQARQLAGEYAVNLSTAQLGQYVQQSIQGKLTADGLQNIFAQQATAAFPWMKDAIAQGVTPAQFLSTYSSAAAQTLGKDASDVRWTTPKYMKALMTNNGTSGTTPVSVGQFQQNLMRTSSFGYQYTQGARDQAYAMASNVLQAFGKVKG